MNTDARLAASPAYLPDLLSCRADLAHDLRRAVAAAQD